MPLFSVIIPAHNVAPYIEETVRSVLSQTEEDYEIIVIDDGSTDETLAILQKITDKRLHVIQQKNFGVSVARNRGIKESRGTYICLLDGDDIWSPIHLEATRNFFKLHPDILWYTSRICNTRQELQLSLTFHQEYQIVNYFTEITVIPSSSSICFSRSLFENELFPPGIHYAEDLVAWTRLACKQPYYGVLAEYTVFYRPRLNSAIHSRPHPRFAEREHGRQVYGIYKQLLLPQSCLSEAKRLMHLRFVERWRFVIANTALPGYSQDVKDRSNYTGFLISCWMRLFLSCLSILVVLFEKPLSFYLRLRQKWKI